MVNNEFTGPRLGTRATLLSVDIFRNIIFLIGTLMCAKIKKQNTSPGTSSNIHTIRTVHPPSCRWTGRRPVTKSLTNICTRHYSIASWVSTLGRGYGFLYQNSETYISANHSLSTSFMITRTVRQGWHLCHNYVLYVLTPEPVLED